MKEVLAAVAILVCGIMAYRVYQVKFPKPPPESKIVLRPLSSVLETFRTALAAKVNKDSSTEVATPLRQLRETVALSSQPAGAHGQALQAARLAALDQLLVVAEEHRQAVEEITRIRNRDSSALERPDSSNTARDFFASTVIRRVEANRARNQMKIDRAFTALQAAEQSVEQHLGPGAASAHYPLYRLLGRAVFVEREERVNPLNREAYDWRRSTRQRTDDPLLQTENINGAR